MIPTAKIDLNTVDNKNAANDLGQVYPQLPSILFDGCRVLTDPTEKAVFLLSGLGVMSGILPNIFGVYDGQKIYPNLFIFVLGRYGGGKGALRYARQLAEQIHIEKTSNTESENEIETQKQKLHFIPANNSKTGFLELLFNNEGTGTLFESEGDTLTDTLNQEFGRFSDALRKSFHHEPISYFRRLNKEYIEIHEPRLSVILSGTNDQLQRLIPTTENGLFSRFCFYQLPENPQFKDVFNETKKIYSEAFTALSGQSMDLYNFLNRATNPYEFVFTPQQKTDFLSHFQTLKNEIRSDITTDLDGMIHRLALQFFRIAMILTVLRHVSGNGLRRPLVCSDQDFEITQIIVAHLKQTAIDVYLSLPQKATHDHEIFEKAKNIERALELKTAGHSYAQIAETIFGQSTKKSTIYRWINH
jgi:hypothetical protein